MESKLGTCDRYKGEIPHVKDRKHKCDGWREQPLDYADIGENFEKIMEFCCKFADTVAKLRRTEFWQGVPARARRGK